VRQFYQASDIFKANHPKTGDLIHQLQWIQNKHQRAKLSAQKKSPPAHGKDFWIESDDASLLFQPLMTPSNRLKDVGIELKDNQP